MSDKSADFERQAFNYSVLADVSRVVNNFMVIQDFLNFTLEILTEYTGRIQGMFLMYSREDYELVAKSTRLFRLTEQLILVPAFDDKAAMVSVKVDNPVSLERTFPRPKLLTGDELKQLYEFVPTLGAVAELYGMSDAILLAHRGEFRGVILLGAATKGSSDESELRQTELLEPLADLLSTSIENIVLREPAVLESLTGTYTHRYFLSQLKKRMDNALTSGENGILLMVDIDNFKSINDTFGHMAGDRVIQRVAGILKENVREKLDFVGRYGGDEFMVFLSSTDAVTGYSVANRMRRLTEQESFKNVGTVTVSIGVSEPSNRTGTVEKLMESADRALYRSKSMGGNLVEMAGGDLKSFGVDVNHSGYERYIKDKVTAFYSGPYFLNRVDGEMKRARRYSRPLSIVAMAVSRISRARHALRKEDLEKVFRLFSNLVLQALRKGIDLPGRFANEQIVFLLPETDRNGAETFVTRLLKHLADRTFPVSQEDVLLGFNAGISCLTAEHRDPPQFIGDAVEALDECQETGEGKFVVAG